MATKSRKEFKLDKGSNRNFDTSKGSKRKFDLTKDDGEQVKDTPSQGGSSATPPSIPANNGGLSNNGDQNNRKWLWIVLAIVVVGLLAWWLMPIPSADENDNIVEQEEMIEDVAVPNVDSSLSVDSVQGEDNQTSETTNGIEEPVATIPEPINQPSIEVEDRSVAPPSFVTSSTVTDIEQKAKSVIRGDFGNGQERKNRLGSEYSEVQKKVNELYSKGLIY